MKNIKTLILLVSLLTITIYQANAQNVEITLQKNNFNTWIKLKNGINYKGRLINLRKNDLVIKTNDGEIQTIAFDKNLDNFKIRKTKAIPKGILTGVLIGSVSGLLIGAVTHSKGDYVSQSGAAMILGAFGGLSGGLVGGVLGMLKLKIDLNGKGNLNRQQLKKLARHNLNPY